MNLWLALLLGGLLTYLLRLSFIALSGREFPTWLERSLRFVPPAVLTRHPISRSCSYKEARSIYL